MIPMHRNILFSIDEKIRVFEPIVACACHQVCYDVRCGFEAWSFTLFWSSLILTSFLPHIQQTLIEIVYIMDWCMVELLLHHASNFIINRTQIWTVRWPQCGKNEVCCVSS